MYKIGDRVRRDDKIGEVIDIRLGGPGGPEYITKWDDGTQSWSWEEDFECIHDWEDLWITGQELLRCKNCGTIEA